MSGPADPGTQPEVDFGAVDEALAAGLVPAPTGSPLERIRALREQAERRQRRTAVSRPVQAPQFAITYRIPTRVQEWVEIQKATAKKRQSDPAADDRLLLVRCCIGIALDGQRLNHLGQPWTDGDDDATFASPAVQDVLGAGDSIDACTLIYRGLDREGPGDGDLSATAIKLLEAGGLIGSTDVVDVEEQDPTRGS